jgi:hypothetical protein
MGSDVYLEWQGMTEEEKKKCYTGYSINAGEVGYLRASIGMLRENQVLRLVFPEKFWNGGNHLYDFKGNISMIEPLVKSYLSDGNIDDCGRSAKQRQFAMSVADIFKKLSIEVQMGASEDKDFKKMWAKSLLGFFLLGMRLQEENKKPKVNISW